MLDIMHNLGKAIYSSTHDQKSLISIVMHFYDAKQGLFDKFGEKRWLFLLGMGPNT